MMKAKVSEVFKSFQGEGLYLGEQQVFVRFFGCNLKCGFCDTPLKRYRELSVGDLAREVGRHDKFHSLCLTGGEPLCQSDFLFDFLDAMPETDVYLETNGTLPEAFRRIRDKVDIVAMDFKLPGSTGQRGYWKEHAEFLEMASQKDVFVKMVIALTTPKKDILKASTLLAAYKGRIPVVLQPEETHTSRALLHKMETFKEVLTDQGNSSVHILPQAHKLAGIR
ncbi:MAG: 7-carboxy-7-deazaguanine synthase QueE [Candidatus Omnitrophota bacterium]